MRLASLTILSIIVNSSMYNVFSIIITGQVMEDIVFVSPDHQTLQLVQ